jgi:hypothetical protein
MCDLIHFAGTAALLRRNMSLVPELDLGIKLDRDSDGDGDGDGDGSATGPHQEQEEDHDHDRGHRRGGSRLWQAAVRALEGTGNEANAIEWLLVM